MNDETPQHNYHRRRTEEMRPDELTNHRLQSLEAAVQELTAAIAASHALLGSINTSLAVGGERHANYDKRLSTLESNQRFVVIGILSSLGLWVWDMIKSIASSGIKLPLIAAAALLTSCIPVTVYAPRDAAGVPMTLPVTASGTIHTPAGPMEIEADYPVSDQPAESPSIPWGTIASIGLTLLGVGGGGIAVRATSIAARTRTALKIATTLVDQVAAADSDEQVKAAKMAAMQAQVREGVHDLTQKIRSA